jgi:hypothetical protein
MSSGTSYNGWPANSDRNAIGVDSKATGAGVMFPGGIKDGDVEKVLGYVADQLNARVEPVTRNSDGTGYGCWGYTYKQNVNNPSSLSCHASGTAIDWIAPSHPNGQGGTFSDSQVATIYAILAEVQGGVDWLEGYDEMHFEISVSASTLAGIAASLPAGGGPPEPPEPEDWWDLMSDAEKDQLLADVAFIKAQLGAIDGFGYPLVIQTMANRVYECQQALRAVKGYGDDPTMYPYTQAFETLVNRVYELTTRPV